MKIDWKPRLLTMPPGKPGPTQGLTTTNARGEYMSICVGLEPYHQDGSFGVHVSIRHQHRRAHDSECDPITQILFNGKPFEEVNGADSKARHFWELRRSS